MKTYFKWYLLLCIFIFTDCRINRFDVQRSKVIGSCRSILHKKNKGPIEQHRIGRIYDVVLPKCEQELKGQYILDTLLMFNKDLSEINEKDCNGYHSFEFLEINAESSIEVLFLSYSTEKKPQTSSDTLHADGPVLCMLGYKPQQEDNGEEFYYSFKYRFYLDEKGQPIHEDKVDYKFDLEYVLNDNGTRSDMVELKSVVDQAYNNIGGTRDLIFNLQDHLDLKETGFRLVQNRIKLSYMINQ